MSHQTSVGKPGATAAAKPAATSKPAGAPGKKGKKKVRWTRGARPGAVRWVGRWAGRVVFCFGPLIEAGPFGGSVPQKEEIVIVEAPVEIIDPNALTEAQLEEEFAKSINSVNPYAPKAVSRFNFKDGAYKKEDTDCHTAIHFVMDGTIAPGDSEEARPIDPDAGLVRACGFSQLSFVG